ncbi:MAG: hypothetical protein EPO23_10160 [Xanthobacteraceae bacterium]|nr:MAG: hypothetical protein EPO23_10160 [Xanthobacteraceae bacterium]
MVYRVYSGPPGSDYLRPMDKERMLFKEFGMLDEAINWARHVNDSGRVTLLIEGDDGTHITASQINVTLRHPERESGKKSDLH